MAYRKTSVQELRVDVWEPDAGSPKATLLLLHGLWVGGWAWKDFAEYLAAAGYACHAPTYRGHYDSKPVPDVGALSNLDYVEDALTVCRAVEADVVIGHSGGGLIAQKVAEAEPSLKAGVFMNSAPPRGIFVKQSWPVIRAQLKYLGRLLRKQAVLPEEQDYTMLWTSNAPPERAADLYGQICADSGRAVLEVVLGKVRVDADRIRFPLYVVGTGKDPALGAKVQRRIARKYGATYAEYPDLGHHWFIEDGWVKAAADLKGWLDERCSVAVA